MAQHPDLELSLYLDDVLAPEERRGVETHLAGCGECRARLVELRGVARLLAAMPERAPRRSLLPRRSVLPGWLVPARWASSVASAVFVLAFVVTNVPIGAPAALPAAQPANYSSGGAAEASDSAKLAATPSAARDFTPASGAPAPAATASSVVERSAERATVAPRGPTAPEATTTTFISRDVQNAPRWLWLVPAAAFALLALGLQYRIARA